jgi:hypothetical protein
MSTAGRDDRDGWSITSASIDYVAQLSQPIRELRAAWSPTLGYAVVDPEVRRLTEAAVQRLSVVGLKTLSCCALPPPLKPWLPGLIGDRQWGKPDQHARAYSFVPLRLAARQPHASAWKACGRCCGRSRGPGCTACYFTPIAMSQTCRKCSSWSPR